MNISYFLHDIQFEWDGQKAVNNLHKHGITFELACEVFFDPFIHYYWEEIDDNENRETIIGMTSNMKILLVVFVLRGDIIRIISARDVTNLERKEYED